MTGIALRVECRFRLAMELRSEPGSGGVLLHAEDVTGDLGDLVDETFTRAVLANELPPDADGIHARVLPELSREPLVDAIEVSIETGGPGGSHRYACRFETGRWYRRALARVAQLREEGTLVEGDRAHTVLTATPDPATELRVPPLVPPTIADESLDAFGVRELGDGALVPDRPVLVNDRMVEELVEHTIAAGVHETGGATLGKTIRLPAPLPGTTTPIVTILSVCLLDPRHDGSPARLTFDPAALDEAARVGDLRARGELVLTACHTHGWGAGCDRCNENELCAIPSCTDVSLDDYQVLESLFPSKATLLPIAGRKFGAAGQRPVLEVHAWRGGTVRPIRWRRYRD